MIGARWIDLQVADGSRLRLDTAAVSVLGWERDCAVLHRWNDTGALPRCHPAGSAPFALWPLTHAVPGRLLEGANDGSHQVSTTTGTETTQLPAQRAGARSPFLASSDGFAFHNSWPSQPAVQLDTPFGKLDLGNAKGGLCGGMVFAAFDYWHAGQLPPADQPAAGTPLYKFLVRRIVDSWHVPVGIAQYYQWMGLPDGDNAYSAFGRRIVVEQGLAWRTIRVQWPQIKKDLDRGVPCGLGLVTVASRKAGGARKNPPGARLRLDTSPDAGPGHVLRPQGRSGRRHRDQLRPQRSPATDDADATSGSVARCRASSASPTPRFHHHPDRPSSVDHVWHAGLQQVCTHAGPTVPAYQTWSTAGLEGG